MHTAYSSDAFALRLARRRRAGGSVCTLSVDGAVVSSAPVGALRGVEYIVSVAGRWSSVPATAYTEEAAEVVADFLLRAAETKHLQACPALVRVAECFADWAPGLRGRWKASSALELASVAVEGGGLVPAFARLYDAKPLLKLGLSRLPRRLEATAWAVLRRMQPSGGAHSSWRASSLSFLGVRRLLQLRVGTAALEVLCEGGCFPLGVACPTALALPERGGVIWVLPIDATVRSMTLGLFDLFGEARFAAPGGPFPAPADRSPLRIPFSELQRDAAPSVAADETLRAWRLHACDEGGVVLLPEPMGWPPAKASSACADLLRPGDVFSSAGLVWADGRLEERFPRLWGRLRASPQGAAHASFNEIRGRALTDHWTLDAVDAGGRLSSFGSALAFCIASAMVSGVDAVAYVSPASRAACLGVRLRRNLEVVLLDPARMHRSPFEFAAEHGCGHLFLRHGLLPLTLAAPGKGGVYELLRRTEWALVLVTHVQKALDAAHVRFLISQTADVVSISASSFRTPTSDVLALASRLLEL